MAEKTAGNFLVQGAGLVAQSEGLGALVASRAMVNIGKDITAMMKTELDRTPGLSDEETKALFDKFKKMSKDFPNMTKKEQDQALRDLLKLKENHTNNQKFKKDASGSIANGDVENLPGYLTDDIKKIMNGDLELVTNKAGESGYMMTNSDLIKYADDTHSEAFGKHRQEMVDQHGNDYSKWKNFVLVNDAGKISEFHPYTKGDLKAGAKVGGSIKFEEKVFKNLKQIEGIIDENKVDNVSKEGIDGIIQSAINQATNWKPGDSNKFNYQKYHNNILNNVIEGGKLKSLANDRIFGGKSFRKNLKEALRTAAYEDLGIGLTEEQVNELDPTDNGRITRKDARVITRKIMQDEDTLKGYLAEYFTKAAEQNFNNNLSEEAKAYVPPKSSKTTPKSSGYNEWKNKKLNAKTFTHDGEKYKLGSSSADYPGEWYTWVRPDDDSGPEDYRGRWIRLPSQNAQDAMNKRFPNAGGEEDVSGTKIYNISLDQVDNVRSKYPMPPGDDHLLDEIENMDFKIIDGKWHYHWHDPSLEKGSEYNWLAASEVVSPPLENILQDMYPDAGAISISWNKNNLDINTAKHVTASQKDTIIDWKNGKIELPEPPLNIMKQDETKATKMFNEFYKDWGIKFETAGKTLGVDKIKITVPNGDSHVFQIDFGFMLNDPEMNRSQAENIHDWVIRSLGKRNTTEEQPSIEEQSSDYDPNEGI